MEDTIVAARAQGWERGGKGCDNTRFIRETLEMELFCTLTVEAVVKQITCDDIA